METKEMNLKIAEWMGETKWYIPYHGTRYNTRQEAESAQDILVVDPIVRRSCPVGFETPDYHSDWNALMPVVERISEKSPALNILGTLHNLIYDYSDNGFNNIADLHLAVYNYIKQTA